MKYQSATTDTAVVISLFDFIINEGGVSKKDLEEKSGMIREELNLFDTRTTMDQFIRLWDVSVELTKNPALGLHVGEMVDQKMMHLIGHLIRNSPDIHQAILQWIRYSRLLSETAEIRLEHHNSKVHLIYYNKIPKYRTVQKNEYYQVLAVTYARKFAQIEFSPDIVYFQHDQPEYIQEYERIFQCPLEFNHAQNFIIFDSKFLSSPIRDPNPYVYEVLSQHAEKLLDEVTQSESIQHQVSKLILEHLSRGTVDIELISGEMGVSRRTLHRKLKQEGTSFQNLLEDNRKTLSMMYLKQEDTSITEIAFLLGFSEPSSFYHAFKRWYGKNPGEYRQTKISV
ncbi:MAG: AraC-like DNA-binding protein [bacterium]|jgi:AraC-like DNA-binding protein